MEVLNQKSIHFLEKYLNNSSPTGYEASGQRIWMEYLKPYVDDFITDTYGTAVGVINPDAPYKVVIEGHSDEISWYVNYINDKGLIYVIRNGGSDHQIAPSKWVNIHTKKGVVKGVFGWPAIHTRKNGKEEPPKLDNIFIDIGAKDKAEVKKMGVHVGCVITYPDTFQVINKDKFICRAIDNRAGGFMIAEVGRLLKENKINYITHTADRWTDSGRVKKYERTENELQNLFHNCCVGDILSILNGKLYRCPFAANAAITIGTAGVTQPGAIGSPKNIGPAPIKVPAIKLNATPSSKVNPSPIAIGTAANAVAPEITMPWKNSPALKFK